MMEYKAEVEEELPLVQEGTASRDGSIKEDLTPTRASTSAHPFKKWMNSFRIRKREPSTIQERYVHGWPSPPKVQSPQDSPPRHPIPSFEPQEDGSSLRSSVLETVRTTTMSTTTSLVTRSRGTTTSTANQSTFSDPRNSLESSRLSPRGCGDAAAEERANKRREVLKELVLTEVDYVQGLKALVGVLSIFNTRGQIQENIQQICGIHEEFLSQLRRVSPSSAENIPMDSSDLVSRGVDRQHSGAVTFNVLRTLQSRPSRSRGAKAAYSQKVKTFISEPSESLEVAQEIEKLSASFSAYERFCSNYELLNQDINLLRRSIPNWSTYDRGIEALSKSAASTATRKHEENTSMSMNDLMIKPIQRLCKYPLILHELMKYTPSSDCPSANEGIRQILDHLRILVTRINSATGNPVNKDRIEKTLMLQEKIRFSEDDPLQDIFKELGPMILCGVLFITYETPYEITGDFMVCVLFHSYLVLAKPVSDSHHLDILACLYMADVKMDILLNGHGMSCYGCPFSWKMIIDLEDDTSELVFSASSAIEEKHWKAEILKCCAVLAETATPGGHWDPRRYVYLALNLVGLGVGRMQYTVASLTRRTSMDAMAISRKEQTKNVLIRKTNFPHTYDDSSSLEEYIEQHSKTSETGHLNSVVAKRGERVRLERLISDVYTRDVLPMPGMIVSRTELFSRQRIMRRLSLHGGFARRSSSVSATHSGPMMTDSRSVDEYSEDKGLIASYDRESYRHSMEQSCESPQTPNSASSTVRFRYAPRKSVSLATPRREQNRSQESTPESPSRKKWGSPMILFNAISPKSPRSPKT